MFNSWPIEGSVPCLFAEFSITNLNKKQEKKNLFVCCWRLLPSAEMIIRSSSRFSASEAATNNQFHRFPLQRWRGADSFGLKSKKGSAYKTQGLPSPNTFTSFWLLWYHTNYIHHLLVFQYKSVPVGRLLMQPRCHSKLKLSNFP